MSDLCAVFAALDFVEATGQRTSRKGGAVLERRDPYTCEPCATRYLVIYESDVQAGLTSPIDVACPRCGAGRRVLVPPGAEDDVLVQLEREIEDEFVTEGGGD